MQWEQIYRWWLFAIAKLILQVGAQCTPQYLVVGTWLASLYWIKPLIGLTQNGEHWPAVNLQGFRQGFSVVHAMEIQIIEPAAFCMQSTCYPAELQPLPNRQKKPITSILWWCWGGPCWDIWYTWKVGSKQRRVNCGPPMWIALANIVNG